LDEIDRELLARASQDNLILRTLDGREFILAEIDDFNHEIELTRQNKASKPKKRIPLAEARRQLGLSKAAATVRPWASR
jgi:hypothetical protein